MRLVVYSSAYLMPSAQVPQLMIPRRVMFRLPVARSGPPAGIAQRQYSRAGGVRSRSGVVRAHKWQLTGARAWKPTSRSAQRPPLRAGDMRPHEDVLGCRVAHPRAVSIRREARLALARAALTLASWRAHRCVEAATPRLQPLPGKMSEVRVIAQDKAASPCGTLHCVRWATCNQKKTPSEKTQ